MLSAKEARNICNDKLLKLLEVNNIKYLPEINNIIKRIEAAIDEKDKITYSIDVTNEELYYIQQTNILQKLGYVITPDTSYPWGGKVSW